MQLIKFKVSNYKTINESEWITTDKITCLVGENESGKTNVLTALLKLNPSDEKERINLISDYPRHKYTEDREVALEKKFIEAIFKFESPYEITFTTSQKSLIDVDTNQEIEQPDLEEKFVFNFVRIERYYNEEYKVFGIVNEEDFEKTETHKELIKNKMKILEKIPKFVYYASYANLSSELYLPHIINDLGRYDQLSEKSKNKAKTLKVLFDFVKLSPQEILDLGKEIQTQSKSEVQIIKEQENKKQREIMLDSASASMTRSFKEWWKQGNYKFKFSADGEYFRIWVSDDIRPENIELENRSSGLQWFFSFYIVFVTENAGEHNNCIILLDEPGHTLHPMAQKDLATFFNSLADKNQLLYTTHSPFLVDSMNITRTKVVYADETGKTNISDNLKINKKAAQKSIYPINSAIGITISDTMLIGTKPIIVEGVSDQIYLLYMKRKLMKQNINLPKELVFMPVDGTKNIKPVVAIITGKEEELPIILLDSDVAGREKKNVLLKNLYKDNGQKLISVSDYLHTKVENAEIEDLMDYDVIVEAVNREFHSDIEDFEYDGSKTTNIIQQIEEYANKNDITLFEGWKVKIAQRYVAKERNELDEILEEWKKLFKNFVEL